MSVDNETVDLNFSLNDFIRQRQMGDQFALLNQRRHKPSISEASLNGSLDEFIRSKALHAPKSANVAMNVNRGPGKFDRKSLRDNCDSEDEDDCLTLDSDTHAFDNDVEMADKTLDADEIASNEENDLLGDLPRFQTIESTNNIRVRSQQFRLWPENIVDRPKGLKRLEFLPLHEVNTGRIQKKKRNSFSSQSKTSSMNSINSVISGSFVEKRNFTYKFGNRTAGNQHGLIGIERAKHNVLPQLPQVTQEAPAAAAAPVIININMGNANPETINAVMSEIPKIGSNVSSAALNALMTLKKKREMKKYDMAVQREIANIQNRPAVFEDNGNEQKVIATEGEGIDDLNIKAEAGITPFGIRFS